MIAEPIPAVSDITAACGTDFRAGMEALAAQDYVRAERRFDLAIGTDAQCFSRIHGLAAEWRGVSVLAQRDTLQALEGWSQALSALSEAEWSRGGDRLVGRYLDLLIRADRIREPRTAQAFDLLLRPTTAPSVEASPAYSRLLAQLASVLPDTVRSEAFRDGDWRNGIRPGGDRTLAEWGVAEDPFPATQPNERLEEHLDRVRYALANYADPNEPEGYDARGSLYVRFGPPVVARSIAFDSPTFVFDLVRAGVGQQRSQFPDNEVWIYEKRPAPLTYIFVKEGDRFRLGTSAELLPVSMRSPSGATPRARSLNEAAVVALRYIYDQLATTELEYGNALASLEGTLDSPTTGRNRVDAVRTFQTRTEVEEAALIRRREQAEPPSATALLTEANRLPVDLRTARFRQPDGSTRRDVWWSVTPRALEDSLPRVTGMVVGSVVVDPNRLERVTETVVARSVSRRQLDGLDLPSVSDAAVPCRRDGCEVAVQVDLYEQVDGVASGLPLRTFVWEAEPVSPLGRVGLEMSDLKPVDESTREPIAGAIRPGRPLSIVFEAYGLAGGARRSQFRVQFEVVRERNGSFLRRTQRDAREGELRSSGQGDTIEQRLVLDTTDWVGSDAVMVTLRVSDLIARREVERTIRLRVESDG